MSVSSRATCAADRGTGTQAERFFRGRLAPPARPPRRGGGGAQAAQGTLVRASVRACVRAGGGRARLGRELQRRDALRPEPRLRDVLVHLSELQHEPARSAGACFISAKTEGVCSARPGGARRRLAAGRVGGGVRFCHALVLGDDHGLLPHSLRRGERGGRARAESERAVAISGREASALRSGRARCRARAGRVTLPSQSPPAAAVGTACSGCERQQGSNGLAMQSGGAGNSSSLPRAGAGPGAPALRPADDVKRR